MGFKMKWLLTNCCCCWYKNKVDTGSGPTSMADLAELKSQEETHPRSKHAKAKDINFAMFHARDSTKSLDKHDKDNTHGNPKHQTPSHSAFSTASSQHIMVKPLSPDQQDQPYGLPPAQRDSLPPLRSYEKKAPTPMNAIFADALRTEQHDDDTPTRIRTQSLTHHPPATYQTYQASTFQRPRAYSLPPYSLSHTHHGSRSDHSSAASSGSSTGFPSTSTSATNHYQQIPTTYVAHPSLSQSPIFESTPQNQKDSKNDITEPVIMGAHHKRHLPPGRYDSGSISPFPSASSPHRDQYSMDQHSPPSPQSPSPTQTHHQHQIEDQQRSLNQPYTSLQRHDQHPINYQDHYATHEFIQHHQQAVTDQPSSFHRQSPSPSNMDNHFVPIQNQQSNYSYQGRTQYQSQHNPAIPMHSPMAQHPSSFLYHQETYGQHNASPQQQYGRYSTHDAQQPAPHQNTPQQNTSGRQQSYSHHYHPRQDSQHHANQHNSSSPSSSPRQQSYSHSHYLHQPPSKHSVSGQHPNQFNPQDAETAEGRSHYLHQPPAKRSSSGQQSTQFNQQDAETEGSRATLTERADRPATPTSQHRATQPPAAHEHPETEGQHNSWAQRSVSAYRPTPSSSASARPVSPSMPSLGQTPPANSLSQGSPGSLVPPWVKKKPSSEDQLALANNMETESVGDEDDITDF